MNWTKGAPTQTGYYWMRRCHNGHYNDPQIVNIVTDSRGDSQIWEFGNYDYYPATDEELEFGPRIIELSNDNDDSVQIKDLRKITIGPDDIVVLLVDKVLRPEQFETVKGQMKLAFPKNRIAILEDGMTLQVLSPADIKAEIP